MLEQNYKPSARAYCLAVSSCELNNNVFAIVGKNI